MSMTLMSPAFADGEPIPEKYSRLGENLMPPLKWAGAPDRTRSFVLTVEDPDAPSGTFHHCGVFNLSGDCRKLAESADTQPESGLRFSENDFGNTRYDGPEPPKGHGQHRYRFRLQALDVPSIPLPGAAGVKTLTDEAQKHALAEATLTGTFEVT
ncbi:YbhB/YbcL family Raf kinase inhibitor-like protein [Rhizobium sp. L1K21]|uniref:YbhB/YbcL family Raf kinase inhibitor-like protein n=1 Tax=Rhizobium sp. L1K21 TaxID=2954933 RepID=UPI002093F8B4|nr:YbhB/YbcL family Raf kinase inhibitor-like protein [Rhizobium sp. L1K21]MCO6187823.1 YbhB/YbcL family Raf kinase inhibitor-like protein [Rhizobium sp. L1K21]